MDDSSAKDAGKQVVPSPLRKGRIVYASATATGRGFASCAGKVIRASVAAGITDRRPGALPRGEEAILFGMPVPDLAALIRQKNGLMGPTIEFGWRLAFLGECRRPKREHADVYLFFGREDDEVRFVSDCRDAYAASPRRVVMLGASQVRLSMKHLLVLKGLGVSAITLTERHAKMGWRLPWDQLLDKKSAARASRTEEQRSAAYCEVITKKGRRTLTKAKYDQLLKRSDEHGLFIDVTTGEASSRQGKGKPRLVSLTSREAGLLADFVQAGRPVYPYATVTGGKCLSHKSAYRIFQKARKKVDFKGGYFEFRSFKLIRNTTDRDLNMYCFDPPADLKYCVIIPASQPAD